MREGVLLDTVVRKKEKTRKRWEKAPGHQGKIEVAGRLGHAI